MNMSKKLIFSAVLALAFSLGGCGSKKETKFSTASRGDVSTTPVNNGQYKLGECNRIDFSQFSFKGQIGTYYDPVNRQFRSDLLNLNLTAVPSDLFNSSTYQILIYRWYQRPGAQQVLNQVPVRFYFVDKLTGARAPQTPVDRLSKATIDQARQALGASWLNVGTAQFFDRVMILLTGMEMQYDAVTFAYYNSASSQHALAQENVLLPAFYSNPNIYRSYNPVESLYTLHPNYTLMNSNATENDYHARIEEICRALSGIDSRIPASSVTNAAPSKWGLFFFNIWGRITESLDALFKSL